MQIVPNCGQTLNYSIEALPLLVPKNPGNLVCMCPGASGCMDFQTQQMRKYTIVPVMSVTSEIFRHYSVFVCNAPPRGYTILIEPFAFLIIYRRLIRPRTVLALRGSCSRTKCDVLFPVCSRIKRAYRMTLTIYPHLSRRRGDRRTNIVWSGTPVWTRNQNYKCLYRVRCFGWRSQVQNRNNNDAGKSCLARAHASFEKKQTWTDCKNKHTSYKHTKLDTIVAISMRLKWKQVKQRFYMIGDGNSTSNLQYTQHEITVHIVAIVCICISHLLTIVYVIRVHRYIVYV